jgi:hypothetical protein
VYVDPQEDDYPANVGFRDNSANYVVIISRFSPMSPDTGKINILVRDQIHADTANLAVELTRSQCTVRLDDETAAKLLGIHEYVIDFTVDEPTFEAMQTILTTLFQGLPGLTVRR